MSRLRIFVSVVFVILFAVVSTLASAEKTLRVATLNSEWFWTPHDGHVDGSRFNKGDPSVSDYDKKLGFYRELILDQSLDLVAFIEIENKQVAKEIVDALGEGWSYAFKQGRDTATGQDVAFVWKDAEQIKVTDFGFPSGHVDGYKPKRLSKVLGLTLRYRIGDTDKDVSFATAHFLSKRKESPQKASKRLMQSKGLVKGVQQFDQARIVVLGDFNDFRASPVLKTLEKQLELRNASVSCDSVEHKAKRKLRYMIDHVLYKGFSCQRYQSISTAPYSDHPIIIAELVL
ncbi:MAG: hypothetical protein MK096_09890 [Oleiphilaceae bacterium]|uniref:endonuclease/exonuclease/phosphatase family protein n=1 Tax=Oleiphilus sp. HI0125 TaxID=1822266 RepID=UPI0007C2C0E9|nr:hypothetical protein [Oleiphilus sp. HI0125]KZZ60626.1 hypothetical protein A3762_02970 [Oleiphilus sp. HI0125]MCH2159071.1 hypothetical protein [Oleiphilaceae bacterium]